MKSLKSNSLLISLQYLPLGSLMIYLYLPTFICIILYSICYSQHYNLFSHSVHFISFASVDRYQAIRNHSDLRKNKCWKYMAGTYLQTPSATSTPKVERNVGGNSHSFYITGSVNPKLPCMSLYCILLRSYISG